MNNVRLTRNYYYNEQGIMDVLAYSLDCYDKVLYHALREYDVDYKLAFFDDINLYMSKETSPEFGKNKSGIHADLFKVKYYYPNASDACNLIMFLLDQGKHVAVNTMFDMLPPYVYFGDVTREGKSNTHYCTIVGYDQMYFLYVEDPSIIVKERVLAYPANHTIGMIKKEIMINAFKEYCCVLEVEVIEKELSHIDRFEDIRKLIVKNYEWITTDSGFFLGREALALLQDSFETEKIYDSLRQDYFWVHLMLSSRKIFLWCLKEREWEYINVRQLIQTLQNSVCAWKTMESLIIKEVYWPVPQNKVLLQRKMEDIIILEEKLYLDNMNCVKSVNM